MTIVLFRHSLGQGKEGEAMTVCDFPSHLHKSSPEDMTHSHTQRQWHSSNTKFEYSSGRRKLFPSPSECECGCPSDNLCGRHAPTSLPSQIPFSNRFRILLFFKTFFRLLSCVGCVRVCVCLNSKRTKASNICALVASSPPPFSKSWWVCPKLS